MAQQPMSLGDKLQSLPRPALYAILFIIASAGVWISIPVPNQRAKASEDFYNKIAKEIPADKPVLISSDWTNSTRGESAGEFKALIRVLMRRNIKFCVFSMADPNAPQVARDTIQFINTERKNKGQREYQRWNDWVNAGFFPNAEAIANAMNNNFRTAFQDKKTKDIEGNASPIFNSPVMKDIKGIEDFSCLIIVTGSKTSNIAIERVTKVPLILEVTGVMGPEMQVYYDSGQVKGLVSGLKGLYDVETHMDEDFKGEKNLDNGAMYYPTLHLVLTLLIIAVITGNVGMMLSKRGAAK